MATKQVFKQTTLATCGAIALAGASAAEADVIVTYNSTEEVLKTAKDIDPRTMQSLESIRETLTEVAGIRETRGNTMYHSCGKHLPRECVLRHVLEDGSNFILSVDNDGGEVIARDRKGREQTIPFDEIAFAESIISANASGKRSRFLAGPNGTRGFIASERAMTLMDQRLAAAPERQLDYDCAVGTGTDTLGDEIATIFIMHDVETTDANIRDFCQDYMQSSPGERRLRKQASTAAYENALESMEDTFSIVPTNEYKSFKIRVGEYATYKKRARVREITARRYNYKASFEVRMPVVKDMPPQAAAMMRNMRFSSKADGQVWIASDQINPGLDFSLDAVSEELMWTYAQAALGLLNASPSGERRATGMGFESQGGGLMFRDMFAHFATIFLKGLPLYDRRTSKMTSTGGFPIPMKATTVSGGIDAIVLVPPTVSLPAERLTGK